MEKVGDRWKMTGNGRIRGIGYFSVSKDVLIFFCLQSLGQKAKRRIEWLAYGCVDKRTTKSRLDKDTGKY